MISPKVSILVPICNVERFLRECLDSLVNQTLKDIEIICINDGSTDNSLSIIREYERRDTRIVVIDKSNSGYGDSMNKGIELARGEYIGIVESDDFASLDMFEKLYGTAKKHDLDIVRTNYLAHVTGRSAGEDTLVENLAACNSYGVVFNPMNNKRVFMCQPAIWTGLYRKELLDTNDVRFLPTPGASFQDTAFYFKAFYAASRVMLLKKGYLHYRIDNANSSVKNQNKLFCVCDEYAEVWRYAMTDAEKFKQIKTWIPRQQFEGYLWNLNRLSPELQQRFYPRYVDEFTRIRANGLIDTNVFGTRAEHKLNRMLDNPDLYFKEEYGSVAPRRSIIACVEQLGVSHAKDALRSLAQTFGEEAEVFAVASWSDAVVSELKNEYEGLGCLRSDADLISQHLVAKIDPSALRSTDVTILGISPDSRVDDLARSVASLFRFASDSNSFAVRFEMPEGSDVILSLPGLVVDALTDQPFELINSLPSNWGALICATHIEDPNGYLDAVDCAKQFAAALLGSDAPYEVKKVIYRGLLSVWASVRRVYSELPWDVSKSCRDAYLSMADMPALVFDADASQSQAPKLSVIVPAYNVSSFLEECLESIAVQTFSDYEVILVNDGSTDETLAALENAARHDNRLRVLSQFNCGAGAARNRGMSVARGERYIFIDPDDKYASNVVFAELYDAMDRTGESICGGSLAMLKSSGKTFSDFSFTESYYQIKKERKVELGEIWTDYGWIRFMYDASLFADGSVKFPQLNWYEDPVFFVKAVSRAHGCYVIPLDVYLYRIGHKKTVWTTARARDMLVGMGENLKVAERLGLGELYATIVRRFNYDYYEALSVNIEDEGVFLQLVDIQASLNHEMIRNYSSFNKPYYQFRVLGGTGEGRQVAIERIAKKVSHSAVYTGAQRLIWHFTRR